MNKAYGNIKEYLIKFFMIITIKRHMVISKHYFKAYGKVYSIYFNLK